MTVLFWILFYILGCIICEIIIIRDWENAQYCSKCILLLTILHSWAFIVMYLGFYLWYYFDYYLWKWFKKK